MPIYKHSFSEVKLEYLEVLSLDSNSEDIFQDSVSLLPEHNEEIEPSIEFPVVIMVSSTIWYY